MFLENQFDPTLLIITSVCFALVIIILLVALILMLKRRMGENIPQKEININNKIFKATLSVFFEALGGTDNVGKIELDENKNCLIVI